MTQPHCRAFALAMGLAAGVPARAAVDAQGNWFPSIGDPSVLGWFTAALYLVTVALAARNLAFAKRTAVPSSFWLSLCVLMFALGVNKQLDLQTWVGITGRRLSIEQGWYADRRIVQGVFIVLLCVGVTGALLVARRHWIQLWGEYRLAFLGVSLLCLFIVVRAITFHHIDRVLRLDLADIRLGALLEICGVLVVGSGCIWWHRLHRRRVARFFRQQALRR